MRRFNLGPLEEPGQMNPKECRHFNRSKEQYSKTKMEHRWGCKKCGKWFLEVYRIAEIYEVDKDDKFKILKRLH